MQENLHSLYGKDSPAHLQPGGEPSFTSLVDVTALPREESKAEELLVKCFSTRIFNYEC